MYAKCLQKKIVKNIRDTSSDMLWQLQWIDLILWWRWLDKQKNNNTFLINTVCAPSVIKICDLEYIVKGRAVVTNKNTFWINNQVINKISVIYIDANSRFGNAEGRTE